MKKLSYQHITDRFQQKKWRVISTEYLGSQQLLNVICPEGHETTITWNNFQRGQGCKFCAGNQRFELGQVQEMFLKEGCELLSTYYEDNAQKLHYRCSCSEESFIRLAEFNRGHRCQKCKAKKLSVFNSTSEETIKECCDKNGCQLLRTFIRNKRMRIEYVCKCGNITEAYWTNFQKFPNCKKCGAAKISGDKCHMYDPDREAIAMRKRFRKMCGQHIHRFMKATAQKKTKRTHELLGYTPQELQSHILNHSDYKNCIGKEWHVDHIFPIQAFLDHGILDLKIINALDNLRPMLGPDNVVKADKYDKKEFVEWLQKRP